MSTMVEKVARALTETQIRTANELFKLTNPRRVRTEERIMAAVESGWRLNEKDARSAIEAMMEPTPEMLKAVDEEEDRRGYVHAANETMSAEDAWPVMIQAALKEEAQ